MFKKWWNLRKTNKLCADGKLPSFYCEYLEHRADVPKSTPIKDLRFIVLDTETTGLNLDKDVLVSIGAIEVQGFDIMVGHSMEILVKRPDVRWNLENASIHEIIKSETLMGMEMDEAARTFLKFLKGDVFVAHHVGFDAQMIQKMINHTVPDFEFYNPMLDTALLMRHLDSPFTKSMYYPNRFSYTLDALIERFGLLAEDRHTAWGDAFTTAHLLVKCLKMLEKNGVHTLGGLLRL